MLLAANNNEPRGGWLQNSSAKQYDNIIKDSVPF